MGIKFDISLEEAMKVLSLKTGFTEKEFKNNYRKLILSIHPDTLGNLNEIQRKIIENEAKRVNIAKAVIEAFLKGKYSDYNVRKSTSDESPRKASENHGNEKQRKGKIIKEQLLKHKKIIVAISALVTIIVILSIINIISKNTGTKATTGDTNIEKLFKIEDTSLITIGSNKVKVENVMGVPGSVYESIRKWVYGPSSISFDSDWKVVEWYNESGNLKVTLGEKHGNPNDIVNGATRQTVVNAMGTPSIIYDSSRKWVYSNLTIKFDSEWKVEGWVSSNTKVK